MTIIQWVNMEALMRLRKGHFLVRVTLAMLLIASSFALASTSSTANGNFAQKTDQEAGCTYGTKPLSEWKMPDPPAEGTVHNGRGYGIAPNDPCYIFLVWTSEIGPSFSYSAALVRENTSGDGMEYICSAATDPNCAASKYPNGQFRSLAGFYKCESAADRNCVSELLVTDPSGKRIEAKFERHFPDAPTIPASDDASMPYPKGGSPTLWSFDSGSGKKFIHVTGVIERNFRNRSGKWSDAAGTFHMGLVPVRVIANKDAVKPRLKIINYTTPDGKAASRVEFSRDTQAGLDGECARFLTMDVGECLVEEKFPDGYRFGLVLQVTKDISFFLNGRLDAPVAFTEALGDGKKVTIEGAPATLFALSGSIPKSVLTAKSLDAIKAARDDFSRQLGFAPSDLPPMETRYPDLLPEILPYFGDKTTYTLKAWTLKSSPTLGRFTQKCYNDSSGEMLGIISTNATAFDGDPPTLDPATNTLSYKVAAPHYAPDGKTENIGRYYMNLNSKFTQCILGVDRVPDVATVGITYGEGKQLVSTVSVKQDKDWLRLQADNFTFSAPQIKVAFPKPTATATSGSTAQNSQQGGQSGGNQPGPSNVSANSKIKRITCIKGNKKRVVSATNPKCPVGWKKK
ncbi:MAG: hypothetical protein FJW51_03250 [Actinobacteria bacterium]|nr:hypothetical protein [Actinomycetota bacterium]